MELHDVDCLSAHTKARGISTRLVLRIWIRFLIEVMFCATSHRYIKVVQITQYNNKH